MFNTRLSNRAVAAKLRELAAKAPHYGVAYDERDKFTVIIDGTRLTCINTDEHILALARKFEKAKSLTTPRRSNTVRREAAKVVYKRYAKDPDAVEFARLLGLA